MKKVFSMVLTLIMVFTMCASALAGTITYETSVTSLQAGEYIDVSIKLDADIEKAMGLQYSLYYNKELFTMTGSEVGDVVTGVTCDAHKDEDDKPLVVVLWNDLSGEGVTLKAGTLCTITFQAKEDILASSNASFELKKVAVTSAETYDEIDDGNVSGDAISVTVNPVDEGGDVDAELPFESVTLANGTELPVKAAGNIPFFGGSTAADVYEVTVPEGTEEVTLNLFEDGDWAYARVSHSDIDTSFEANPVSGQNLPVIPDVDGDGEADYYIHEDANWKAIFALDFVTDTAGGDPEPEVDYSNAKIVIGYTEGSTTKYNEIDGNRAIIQVRSQAVNADYNWPINPNFYVLNNGEVVEDVDWSIEGDGKIFWNTDSSDVLTQSKVSVRSNEVAVETLKAVLPDGTERSVEVESRVYVNTVSGYTVSSDSDYFYNSSKKTLIVEPGATVKLTANKLFYGESHTMSDEELASNTLVWTSDDTSIATVDAQTGEYSFVGEGETTIALGVVGQENGKTAIGKLKSINVFCGDKYARDLAFSRDGQVLAKEYDPQSNGYAFARTDVAIGGSQQIELVSLPEGANENISISAVKSASTSNVTAELKDNILTLTGNAATDAPVKVTVTWKRTNVSTLNSSFSTALYVDVKAPTAITEVKLDQTALTLTEGETGTLTATVIPDNAADKTLAWTSSDEAVATVVDGKVTAVGAGTATITATAKSGVSASCEVTVKAPTVVINDDHADMRVTGDATAAAVASGDKVLVYLSVENDQNAASVYNSYEFQLTYDADKLTYDSASCNDVDTELNVKNENGKLIVNGYGENKTVSEDALITLSFIAGSVEEAAEAAVTMTGAYRDTSANAIDHDIDAIDIETEKVTVAIQPTEKVYTVTFSENVMVNGEQKNSAEVKAGESVSFSLIAQAGKTASVMAGDTVLTAVEGVYTVTPTADTAVTIEWTANTYSVTKDAAAVEGAGTATHGVAYSFTVKSGYELTKVTVNGATVTPTNNGNGSYTIPAASVTGPIVISTKEASVTPTPDTYTVTLYKNGESAGTLTAATENSAYTYTLEDGYKLYKVTVGGNEVSYSANGSVYTIEGVNVIGNIEIYIGKIVTVSLPEDDSVTGESSASYGTDYTFTVKEGYVLGTVTIGGAQASAADNGNGTYTISGDTITGDIAITTTPVTYTESVEVFDYVKADDAVVYQLVVATAKEGALAEGECMQYSGANMFWSAKYNGYAYLVEVAEGEEKLTADIAAANIGKAAATATVIAYEGDINITGYVDVNDAQLVYDIYLANEAVVNAASMEKMLRADMNGDKAVTVGDVTAVVAIVKPAKTAE